MLLYMKTNVCFLYKGRGTLAIEMANYQVLLEKLSSRQLELQTVCDSGGHFSNGRYNIFKRK